MQGILAIEPKLLPLSHPVVGGQKALFPIKGFLSLLCPLAPGVVIYSSLQTHSLLLGAASYLSTKLTISPSPIVN